MLVGVANARAYARVFDGLEDMDKQAREWLVAEADVCSSEHARQADLVRGVDVILSRVGVSADGEGDPTGAFADALAARGGALTAVATKDAAPADASETLDDGKASRPRPSTARRTALVSLTREQRAFVDQSLARVTTAANALTQTSRVVALKDAVLAYLREQYEHEVQNAAYVAELLERFRAKTLVWRAADDLEEASKRDGRMRCGAIPLDEIGAVESELASQAAYAADVAAKTHETIERFLEQFFDGFDETERVGRRAVGTSPATE